MRAWIAFAFLLTSPLAAHAASCRYSAHHDLDIDAGGVHAMTLNLGSSDAHVQGVAGLTHIEVKGTACASSRSGLKGFDVTRERDGDRVTVTAVDAGGSSFFGFGYRYMHLQVRVPKALTVHIRSGSGDVQASDLAALDFDSGSGDLAVQHIAGALTLQLGSADTRGRDVGSVALHGTGSGDVRVDGIRQGVRVGHSGSGDLHFGDVGGDVSIQGTGSGDIDLDHVHGSVTVGSSGSGDIDAHGVGGDFTVQSIGSGEVRHSDVAGKISVPNRDD